MRPLAMGWSVEVDRCQSSDWPEITQTFADNNIYQAWEYESARDVPTSHVVVRHQRKIVAAAQARLIQFKAAPSGIAYIRWGPLWRHGQGESSETFRYAIRAIHNEYVVRRGLYLRVSPALFDDGTQLHHRILLEEGLIPRQAAPIARTLLLDLNKDLASIRSGFDRKWRNILGKAERSSLQVVAGPDDELFSTFVPLYLQMRQRKKFDDGVDVRHFVKMQARLSKDSKMQVLLCYTGDRQLAAGLVISALGDTGIYLFGATSELGMKTGASYLLQWHAIQHLKDLGIAVYNLHGINPDKNPGTYHFKVGLCGRNGTEARFLGQYEACGNWLAKSLITSGELLRVQLRSLVPRMHKLWRTAC